MAANLAAAVHEVTGFDMLPVEIRGIPLASSSVEVAIGKDVVITMLPNGQILRSVANEIIPCMEQNAVFVACSTVDVESSRDVATQVTITSPALPQS